MRTTSKTIDNHILKVRTQIKTLKFDIKVLDHQIAKLEKEENTNE